MDYLRHNVRDHKVTLVWYVSIILSFIMSSFKWMQHGNSDGIVRVIMRQRKGKPKHRCGFLRAIRTQLQGPHTVVLLQMGDIWQKACY